MLRKSVLLAVAASAALGLAMLSPTVASAKGHGGGGMHGGHGGGHPGGHIGRPHFHPHWHVRYHRPIWYGPRPVYVAARPVAGPCTCLSKEYTPEGAVLFKDRCTNEMAMNPPAQPDPQQTGAAETQQQYAQQYVQPTPANAQPAK
jgi:hypothetical protein